MIYSFSKFYYNTKVRGQPYNGSIDINEGLGDFTVLVPVKDYTLSTLAIAIQNALNSQGTLTYSVSVNRFSRLLTISADAPFTLLTNTGVTFGESIWDLIGFDTSADLTGSMTYTGISSVGSVYSPQFRLQSFVGPEDFQERNQASKNVAAIGTVVEVINFGIARYYEFDIKFITNELMDGKVIRNNPTGHEDAIAFLKYITELNEFEFMEDENDPNTFSKVIVESMPGFADGTGYKLKELFDRGLQDIYETGIIKLRIVD